jgi:hypothetical protein
MRSHCFTSVFSAVATYIVWEVFDTATELAVATRSESLILVNIAISPMTQGAFIFSRIFGSSCKSAITVVRNMKYLIQRFYWLIIAPTYFGLSSWPSSCSWWFVMCAVWRPGREFVSQRREEITTTRCVTAQKSAVLVYFEAESWNHLYVNLFGNSLQRWLKLQLKLKY